jgi:hypothetical protein
VRATTGITHTEKGGLFNAAALREGARQLQEGMQLQEMSLAAQVEVRDRAAVAD